MLNASCPIAFLYTATSNLTDLTLQVEAVEHTLQAQFASSIAVAIVLLAGSALLLFAGARLVKPALFLSAFGVCFFAGLVAVRESFAVVDLPAVSSCVLLGAAPLALGLLGGLAALCLVKLGFALLGAACGTGVGYTVYSAALALIPNPVVGAHQELILVACLVVGAVVGAGLLLRFQEALLIVATAGVGAAGATPAIALLLAHANARFLLDAAAPASPYAWVQPACTLVLFAAGTLVQCRHRKKKARKEDERSTPLMSP